MLKRNKNLQVHSVLIFFCTCIGMFSSCITTRELRATILDMEGNPVPNSFFYAESYTHRERIIDFVHAQAGLEGEVPPDGNKPLTIRWQSDAQLVLAIFAPGKKTIVVFDRTHFYDTNEMVFNLQSLSNEQQQWQPEITHLAFPFENNEKLQSRIKLTENNPLIKIFLQAYLPIISGQEPAVKRERKKAEAIQKLVKEIGIDL